MTTIFLTRFSYDLPHRREKVLVNADNITECHLGASCTYVRFTNQNHASWFCESPTEIERLIREKQQGADKVSDAVSPPPNPPPSDQQGPSAEEMFRFLFERSEFQLIQDVKDAMKELTDEKP